jgi:hypothetical protein
MAYKSKHGKLIKKCKIAPSDIFTMTDAWFDKGESGDGWVFMLANSNGRNCINALFPKAHIEWRDGGEDVPDDWRGFEINLPNTAEATEHRLPLEITGGKALEDCSEEALAFLMVCAVNRQGGRAGCLNPRDNSVLICSPHAANN